MTSLWCRWPIPYIKSHQHFKPVTIMKPPTKVCHRHHSCQQSLKFKLWTNSDEINSTRFLAKFNSEWDRPSIYFQESQLHFWRFFMHFENDLSYIKFIRLTFVDFFARALVFPQRSFLTGKLPYKHVIRCMRLIAICLCVIRIIILLKRNFLK